ncbi:MFS transporter [Variovorax humicola]|uniref:MFS transporter n=1 Tax=Variovorax humicola TaxID=1769758 RepID=A0ABU8VYA0_9BURK
MSSQQAHALPSDPGDVMRQRSQNINADAVYRKVLWHLLPMLVIVYIIAYIDRSNVGFAKLGFMRDLNFSDTVFGIGAGVFYAGYMIFEIPSNLMLAKVGFRKTLLRIMLLWAACSVLLAIMTSPNSYYFARCLLGAAEAGLFPGVLLYLTYWVPAARRASFTAVFMAAIPLSGVISGPLSGMIMHSMDGWQGLKGWQWLFLIEGAPALLFAIVVFYFLKDTPASAPWLSSGERDLIEADLEADRNRTGGGGHHSFMDALRSPRFYLLVGMGVALLASASNISFWLPTIIQRSGVTSTWIIGLMAMAPYIVGVVAQQWVARRSDVRDERRWHAAACAMVSALGWILLPMVSSNPVLSLLALIATAAGTFAAMGPFWSMPALYLSAKAAPGGIALISTLAGIGSLISPVIIGWLNESTKTLAAGQYYLAALMIVGAVTVVAIGHHNRSHAAGGPRLRVAA